MSENTTSSFVQRGPYLVERARPLPLVETQPDGFAMVRHMGDLSKPMKGTRLSVLVPPALLALILLSACAGYVPGRGTYWDHKIKELCNSEGQLQVFEQVVLTSRQAAQMPRVEGKLTTRAFTPQSATDPVYSERKITYLNDHNPRVSREEVSVVRSADGKVVAQWIEYARVGGDISTGIAHHSSFRCPDSGQRLDELQRLFVVTPG